MIITKHLLSKFVDISAISLQELCAKLNDIGLEVEGVTHIEIPNKVVVGKVLTKTPHPNADKLNVNQITFFFHVLTNSYAAGCPGKFRSEVP